MGDTPICKKCGNNKFILISTGVCDILKWEDGYPEIFGKEEQTDSSIRCEKCDEEFTYD